jgi:hypothetical protein
MLPLYLRPFLYFFYRYFLRLGFLDGKEGFIFHFHQALWYRLLVDINLDELRCQTDLEPDAESRQILRSIPRQVDRCEPVSGSQVK